eukprot:GHRQ01019322.1.p1 GENE.GHRQ01019322.1~~GHRQ01019322.1.p1  ORF type:complete len:107 (+),score=31.05 GHRQ01019322.1:28-321(+)
MPADMVYTSGMDCVRKMVSLMPDVGGGSRSMRGQRHIAAAGTDTALLRPAVHWVVQTSRGMPLQLVHKNASPTPAVSPNCAVELGTTVRPACALPGC